MTTLGTSSMAGPGVITGTFYNEHRTLPVRIREVTVSSGRARSRSFTVDYLVKPQSITPIYVSTGLHLTDKDEWNIRVTRAEFIR